MHRNQVEAAEKRLSEAQVLELEQDENISPKMQIFEDINGKARQHSRPTGSNVESNVEKHKRCKLSGPPDESEGEYIEIPDFCDEKFSDETDDETDAAVFKASHAKDMGQGSRTRPAEHISYKKVIASIPRA